MIRITDFKNYNDFQDFIVNYLKQENILEDFKYNLKEYNCSHENLDNYINYIYTHSIKLDDFFVKSFPWSLSYEGTRFWREVDIKYLQYLKNGLILSSCWDD